MSAPARRVAGVILAAGSGSRFGAQKLVVPVRGKTLLQHALDAAIASALDPLVLVVGADADAVLAASRPGRASVVRNLAYASGMASSLRAGIAAVGDADAAVVILGDMPGVTASLLDLLVERQRATGASAVVSASRGRRTPPALLHRELFGAVAALEGDVGARELIAGRADVEVVEVSAGLGTLDDVDTAVDRERLLSS